MEVDGLFGLDRPTRGTQLRIDGIPRDLLWILVRHGLRRFNFLEAGSCGRLKAGYAKPNRVRPHPQRLFRAPTGFEPAIPSTPIYKLLRNALSRLGLRYVPSEDAHTSS